MPRVEVSPSLLKYFGGLEAACLRLCKLVEPLWVVESLRSVSFLNVKTLAVSQLPARIYKGYLPIS